MKLSKVLCVGTLALTLAACSSTTTSSKTSSVSSTSTTDEAETEEVVTEGKYEVTNSTGSTIKELYFYDATSSDKGDNYLTEDLADGDTTTVEVSVDEDEADGYSMKVEYVTEDGDDVVVFETLSLEEASMYLKSASDVESGATPFTKPE
jgi:hypothetical protein